MAARRRVWRKIHLGIDEERLEVRAVQVTGSHIGGAPILRDPLNRIPAGEKIGSVTADGAYDTREWHDAIAGRGAHAVIPPRRPARHGGNRAARSSSPVSWHELPPDMMGTPG